MSNKKTITVRHLLSIKKGSPQGCLMIKGLFFFGEFLQLDFKQSDRWRICPEQFFKFFIHTDFRKWNGLTSPGKQYFILQGSTSFIVQGFQQKLTGFELHTFTGRDQTFNAAPWITSQASMLFP